MEKKIFLRIALVGLLVLGPLAAIGRAQLGKRSAKEWLDILETKTRIDGMKIGEVVSALKLRPGDTVADIGAGTGLFSMPLAKAVGPQGRVLAEDIDPDLLDIIADKARKQGIGNVETVLGGFDDPKLPGGKVDLALFNDVLHHIEHRELYLKNLGAAMKPKGRIAVIDLTKGHPGQPEMQIKQDQVVEWMKGVGFHLSEEVKMFDDKYFVVFER